MHYVRDLIYRLRAGESERRVAADLGLSRPTVRKYRLLAENRGYLETWPKSGVRWAPRV